MRHTIYIILTAVLGVMMDSCGYSSRTSRVLDSAESVMAVSPDSAYRILSSLPDPFPGDGGQYARYALLRTESEYKSGMCPSSDTLISVAVDYYSRRDPGSSDCMRSYYYQGRVRIYAENYGDAIVSLLNSERAARRHSDHLMLGLIYRGIADSYNSLVDDGSAHEYYRLSYEEFCKAPENIYTDYALCDLARSSNNAFRYEEGLDAAKKLYGIAIKKQDIDLICGSLGCLGRSYAGLERYDSARTAFMELSEYPYPYVSVKDWIEIGLCHIRDNELDKAISVNDSIKKYRPSEHSLLYFIYKSQKKYSDANPLLIEEMELQNDEIKRFVLRNFSHVVRNYYNLQLDKTTAVLEKQRFINIMIFTIGLFLIVAIAYIYYRRINAYRRKMEITISSAMNMEINLKDRIDVLNEQNRQTTGRLDDALYDLNESNRQFKELVSAQFQTMYDLCDAYYQYRGNKNEQKKIYERVVGLLHGIGSDTVFIGQLTELANRINNGIMSRLADQIPTINDNERKVFLYIILGFSSSAISVLQNVSIATIYNRKYSLKQKILNSSSRDKDEFIGIVLK